MFDLNVNISLPHLDKNKTFTKGQWGYFNILVGPNGTGKSIFAENLKTYCTNKGLKTRYLNAERLSGLEKRSGQFSGSSNYNQGFNMGNFDSFKQNSWAYDVSVDAFVILKQKPDLKIKIESILSEFFGKSLRLVEEAGYLVPKIIQVNSGEEYKLKENESHGLKEIITLLTILYDDENDVLIIDEPELHLHPQFQMFFLQEMRKIAGTQSPHGKKCFFIMTHSPFFVDLRNIDDLKNCLIFHKDKLPTFVDVLNPEDELRLKRFLPRLNTHHKQFFFASRPIFVEGYTDQQILSLIQEKRNMLIGASGSSIIDVGGKENLDVFFRLCNQLKIDGQYITDLDAIFDSKLRQTVSLDQRCKDYLHNEGLSSDLMSYVGELESKISNCIEEFIEKTSLHIPPNLQLLREEIVKSNEIKDKRRIFLIGLMSHEVDIAKIMPMKQGDIDFINGKIKKIIDAFKTCDVYILPNGQLENYLPSYVGNPFTISGESKIKAFEAERDFLLETELSADKIKDRYGEIIIVLDNVSLVHEVRTDLHTSYEIADWIHKVQSAVSRGQIKDKQSLETNTIIELNRYSRIFELKNFDMADDGFTCTLKLKPLVDPIEREIQFDNKTVPANFRI